MCIYVYARIIKAHTWSFRSMIGKMSVLTKRLTASPCLTQAFLKFTFGHFHLKQIIFCVEGDFFVLFFLNFHLVFLFFSNLAMRSMLVKLWTSICTVLEYWSLSTIVA